MAFIKNIWYAAAWSADICDQLFSRTIAGKPVLIYRLENGSLTAMLDRCPHRFAPLHKGQRVGDQVQCGYHGLRFNREGRCVHNPHGGAIPQAARVDTYPVVEKNGLVWLWQGDPSLAREELIPDFHQLDESESYAFGAAQTMHMEVNYMLIVDNLLDLGHVAYLHASSLGASSAEDDVTSCSREGNTVFSFRTTPNKPPAPVFVATGAADASQRVDYWVNMRWDPPASFFLDAGIAEAGLPKETGKLLSSVQIVTPETESTSFYFWKMFRTYQRDNVVLSDAIDQAVKTAFGTEDEPMILSAQDRMQGSDFWSLKPVLLKTDAAAVMARRTLEKLLSE